MERRLEMRSNHRRTELPTAETIVEWLLRPGTYDEPPGAVTLLETHISWVFLTSRHAFKLKRPVRFEFLDFSTPAARRAACEEELRINRRLAPDVYLGLRAITMDAAGELHFDGPGEPVDWVVQMRRLPADRTLDHLIRSGALQASDVQAVADRLSRFYLQAPPLTIRTEQYCRLLEAHIRANRQELLDTHHHLPRNQVQRVHAAQLRLVRLTASLLENRARDGRIVEGHGDLRPEHIYLAPEPVVIDAVEFSRELRQLDVLDELCFLAMECDYLGAPHVGQRMVDAYLVASGDAPPAPLIPFYKSYRACVRAKVSALRSDQLTAEAREEAERRARRYLDLADQYARSFAAPLLIVVRGLMGTGKSTLALALSDALGMELLQTDVIRGEVVGQEPTAEGYGAGKYRSELRAQVYQEMFERAGRLLHEGVSVVLDGTFLSTETRQQAAQLAAVHGAEVVLLRCECPEEVAKQRIAERLAEGGSASEARPEWYEAQRADEAPDPLQLASTSIDTTSSLPLQLEAAFAALRRQGALSRGIAAGTAEQAASKPFAARKGP